MAVFWSSFLWTSVLYKINHWKVQKRSLIWQLQHYFSLLKIQIKMQKLPNYTICVPQVFHDPVLILFSLEINVDVMPAEL